MRRLLLPAVLMALATGATAIVACGGDDSDGGSTEDIKAAQGLEGATCNTQKKCKAGLVCKAKSNGPPPGALGMPVHTTSGPPPGALGMPAPPSSDTCQKPAPGEEGAECRSTSDCSSGLSCEIESSSSSSGGPPPGVLGMPILPKGTCQKKESSSSSSSTGGPPPGALGMPIHH